MILLQNARYVLRKEKVRTDCIDDPKEVGEQQIPGVVTISAPDATKTLTRRTTDDARDRIWGVRCNPTRRRSEGAVISAISTVACAVAGKFLAWIPIARGSESIAPRILNPARAAPKLKPPAPQNRSIIFGALLGIWGGLPSMGDQGIHESAALGIRCTWASAA